jgi:hypothetical protein
VDIEQVRAKLVPRLASKVIAPAIASRVYQELYKLALQSASTEEFLSRGKQLHIAAANDEDRVQGEFWKSLALEAIRGGW